MKCRRRRGAAVLELALVTPVLVALVFAGQLLTELILVRLELREAARFAVWDVTDRSTVEDGALAGGATSAARYARGDGLGEGIGLLHLRTPQATSVVVSETEFAWRGQFAGLLSPDAGGGAARLAARLERDPLSGVEAFGFSSRGLVTATASTEVRWREGLSWLAGGGRSGMDASESSGRGRRGDDRRDHRARPFESVTLIAGTWHVDDGRDVVPQGGRSGVHPDGARSQLWRVVDRGRWLGGEDLTAGAFASASAVQRLLFVPPPDVNGTYVVSLRAGQRSIARRCPELPNFPRHGLSAVADLRDLLDDPAAACFSTQPLRDTHEYAASLPLQALAERGDHFLGCAGREADDPTRSVDDDLSDASTAKVHCGAGR